MKIYLLCYATTAALGITAFQPASLLQTFPRRSSCCSCSLRLRPPPLLTTSCSSSALNFSPDATSTSSSSTTKTADDAHYQLDQKTWMFQNKYPIAYEVARVVSNNDTSNDAITTTVPILLLNGFGVG